MTHDALTHALREFEKVDGTGKVTGYDKVIVDREFAMLQESLKIVHLIVAERLVSIKVEMPKVIYGWSERDYLVVSLYSYDIGRTRDGKWVDMSNKPIKDVTHYMELPYPIDQ